MWKKVRGGIFSFASSALPGLFLQVFTPLKVHTPGNRSGLSPQQTGVRPPRAVLLRSTPLSARMWTFWFWTERLSCCSGALASRWRFWAFSWVDSVRRHRAGRVLCTWPLKKEKIKKTSKIILLSNRKCDQFG